jgi:hypothetical protein
VTTKKKLYGWDVDRDRRFACADSAPYDDDGKPLILFNGMTLDESVMINLDKPKRGEIADFLYSPLLLMFVSARTLEVIQRGHVPNIGVHRLILRDAKGRVVDEDNYFWINVKPLVMLLDTERSVFQQREDIGGVKRVDKLVIREENVPEDDLFLMKELNLPVFSETIHREIEAKKLRGARFRELESLTWPVW